MLLALLLACQTTAGPVTIDGAYARATPPGTTSSAIFLTLHNAGAERAVTAASASVAESVELHTHIHEDGQARMRRVPQIDLPTDSTVTLEPGGLHVMLIGLHEPLAVGSVVDFSLTLRDGEVLSGEAPVREIGASHHE